jgi:hypothetical protein
MVSWALSRKRAVADHLAAASAAARWFCAGCARNRPCSVFRLNSNYLVLPERDSSVISPRAILIERSERSR